MGNSILAIALYVLGGVLLGAACGWLFQAINYKRRIARISSAAMMKLDDVTAERDHFAHQFSRSEARTGSLHAALAKRNTELESVRAKSKLLASNVLMLRTERENTKSKLSAMQKALVSLRQQTNALQVEFEKTQDFYKRELAKALEQRKVLEKDVREARSDQEAFAKRVESASLEHGSAEDMVIAAQLRLGQIDVLERNANKLEAENAALDRDLVTIRQELRARERDLAEMEELRIHNKQLVSCVEALEGSRQAHESDAERYREKANQSEELSDTLRLKLDDLEKNFADIEKQQDQALNKARDATVVPMRINQR